ncbi:hypothetical protein F0L74_17335 [Chitinophaga agrisoli]|uniref:Transglutaminase-like domain-containing protein n=1 Tax=Chitinophaga agrisoli TaxID=2607653 RepID=A0A5B2VTJ1_9BACT|nr:transglutaminase domain-containing protein [Chitinophaga agrisoli]KAA2241642.1 hypothetical protein F0L74_17335 [Chitinophaga agrisoli]
MRVMLLLAVLFGMTLNAQAQAPTAKPAPAFIIPDSVTHTPEQLSDYLAGHTSSARDFVKQLFTWITVHVSYDVAAMYQPGLYKDTADAANKTLATRQGVCQGYASLYYMVCRRAGIPVYLVAGYTQINGKLADAAHAWVAVNIDNTWYMTDPTWGAGALVNGQFVRRANGSFFLVQPGNFVKTHMPFDPLFQLLEHPFRQEEFRDNNWALAASRPVFHYQDSLAIYNKEDQLSRYQHTADRIIRNGITNTFTGTQLQYLQNAVAAMQQNKTIDARNGVVHRYNSSGDHYNMAVNQFNEYVNYRNNQFRPSRPDAEIRGMIDSIASSLQLSKQELSGLEGPDAELGKNIQALRDSQTGLEKRVEEEQAFVTKYLKTGKLFRKTLFYKIRGFGG